jgi:ABC-type dipeptide/oligopeptide/nickel transport system ATPase component/MFS family permease
VTWAPLVLFRRLPGVVRLLLLSQLAFNVGFYLVVPFLAVHLTEDLALAGGVVGLVLGIRTFSQQGLFFLGGGLADRFGVRPVVLVGCTVRIAGFLVLAVASSLPAVLLGTVLVGFAAALFSPAVESALADQGRQLEEAGVATRAEVFGLDAIASKLGSVTGPVLGAVLLAVPFRLTCVVAAGVFAVVLAAHVRWLPRDLRTQGGGEPVLAGWGQVLRNRTFLAFTACYCTYLLSYNQLYLALPVELTRATGGQSALGWLFVLAAVLVLLFQLRVTARARRAGARRALPAGFLLMSASFLLVAVCAPLPSPGGVWALAPAVGFVVLLYTGQMVAVPVAQDLVPRLAGERRLGAHFGFLASAGGLAVLVGSTAVGALLDRATTPQPAAATPWLVLAALPAASAAGLWLLIRRLPPTGRPVAPPPGRAAAAEDASVAAPVPPARGTHPGGNPPPDPDREPGCRDDGRPRRGAAPVAAPVPALAVEDLTVSFGARTVVSGVDLVLDPGERVALLGASGSGKTLVARAVLGALPPGARASGRVRVGGVDVLGLPAARRPAAARVAGVSQDPSAALNPLVPVGRQLAMPLRDHRLHGAALARALGDRLAAVGIEDPDRVLRSCAGELSGGQRQRVCIALALASRAGVLVADEPTTALDLVTQAQVVEVLRGRAADAALLFITHDVAVAAALCTRALVLWEGRVVEQGPLDRLVADPVHPHTRALVRSARRGGDAVRVPVAP